MKSRYLKKALSLALCFSQLAVMSGCSGETPKNTPTETKDVSVTQIEIDPALIVTPEKADIDTTITLSPLNASKSEFDGWGTSLCWWANRLGYSDELAQQSADLFYGDDGLRMNIMRYNIGGGDNPSHTHITRTDSMVPGWLVKDGDEYVYDYDADHNQLNVMERCVKAAGDDAVVEVFSNSPPYFMTVSGCSSGGTDSNVDNLRDDAYEDFAEYLAHVTDYIQNKLGIKVTSVSPMNEPNTNFWGAYNYKQEGCHFDAGESQSRIIELTAKALKNYDLDNVIVAASDETSTELQIQEYNSYSDAAKKVIGRINTHTYNPTRAGELGQLARDEGFKLWMSEVDGNGSSGENAGEMGAALWFGQKIISDINALTPSAWIMWQAIDKHICEEGYLGRQDSGMIDVTTGFWGLAVADHDNVDIILTQKYYGMGQFTRFIRPGCTLITCGSDSLAAYDPESNTLSIVALNATAGDKTANFNLSQFKSIGAVVKAVRTSGSSDGGEQWAQLDDIYAYDTGFVAELKANSITTFVINGVEMGDVNLEEISLKGASVTGSTPWNNGADIAEKVIDGDTNTFFDGVADGWLEIDLGKKVEFDVIGFAPRTGFEGRMFKGKFYGSNDGKEWTELYEVTQSPAAGMNYAYMADRCKYRYIRYDVPAGGGDYLCNIAEVKLYEVK